MATLDRTKEELAYLKFWQGIFVVTDISVAGWLISTAAGTAPPTMTFVLAALGVGLLSIVVMRTHRQIAQRIETIGHVKPWKRSRRS